MKNDPRYKFKVRVRKQSGLIAYYNYDIALEFGAKEGFTIEDPELHEKLAANGLAPVKKEAKPIEHEVKKQPKEETNEPKIEDSKEEVDYSKMKMPELREKAKEKGINSFGLKKVDLIKELQNG